MTSHQRIQFIVKTSANTVVPPEWKAYTAHPPQEECQNCHAGKQPGDFQEDYRCQRPASAVTSKTLLQPVMPTTTEVLAECVLCHNPHGSTEKFHLKMTRETACKQCHG